MPLLSIITTANKVTKISVTPSFLLSRCFKNCERAIPWSSMVPLGAMGTYMCAQPGCLCVRGAPGGAGVCTPFPWGVPVGPLKNGQSLLTDSPPPNIYKNYCTYSGVTALFYHFLTTVPFWRHIEKYFFRTFSNYIYIYIPDLAIEAAQ